MLHRNEALFLRHMMMQKLAREDRMRMAGLAGQQFDPISHPDEPGGMQMTETRVYIGLNDAETREQLYETETYLDILKEVCRNCQIAFSVDVEEGGYFHEDGEYVQETSLVLVLIDAEREKVKQVAQELRTRFHQESVLVTEDRIGGCYLYEDTKG
jgi:hypothetical protein